MYTSDIYMYMYLYVVVLQQIQRDAERFPIEPELHPDNIRRQWDRFSIAQQEKDMAIQAEIAR